MNLLDEVTSTYCQRRDAAERAVADALAFYREAVQREDSPKLDDAARVLAAMDLLGITRQELITDVAAVRKLRGLQGRIDATEEALRVAHEAFQAAATRLHEAQVTPSRSNRPLEYAQEKLTEAEAATIEPHRARRRLTEELNKVKASAPRVFSDAWKPVDRTGAEIAETVHRFLRNAM